VELERILISQRTKRLLLQKGYRCEAWKAQGGKHSLIIAVIEPSNMPHNQDLKEIYRWEEFYHLYWF